MTEKIMLEKCNSPSIVWGMQGALLHLSLLSSTIITLSLTEYLSERAEALHKYYLCMCTSFLRFCRCLFLSFLLCVYMHAVSMCAQVHFLLSAWMNQGFLISFPSICWAT